MALGTNTLLEQEFLRRVMHVDIVFVGKHELDVSEHVIGPRRLIDVEAANVDPSPVDRGRINLLSTDLNVEVVVPRTDVSPPACAR